MASNLSSIGFVFDDDAEFQATMTRLVNEAIMRLACDDGEYAIWRSRTGAEIWFHLVPESPGSETLEPVGLIPFFEGQSENAFRTDRAFRCTDDNLLEGRLVGWIVPKHADGEGYPLVLEAVDYAAHYARRMPATWTVRLTGFARQLTAYASEADYLSVSDRRLPLNGKSFVAAGLLEAKAEAAGDAWASPDAAVILLTGTVIAHEQMTNEASGGGFHWLLIESADATTYDIVADPEVVSGAPSVGGTVEVMCHVFARVID